MSEPLGNPVALIETIYAGLEKPAAVWLADCRATAALAFPDMGLAAAFSFRIDAAARFETKELAHEPERVEQHLLVHRMAPPEAVRAVYLSGPVVTLRRALARSGHGALIDSATTGVTDWVGCVGIDPSGHGVALSWAPSPRRPASRPLSRVDRAMLSRIAAHLASASRLRAAGATEEAVVSGGEVVHASGEARGPEIREALREAARAIDRARLRGGDPIDRVGLWRALVDGRWSLIERIESDGRRIHVARRNDPTTAQSAALDAREQKVTALVAVGRPLKVVAYELGLSEPAVSVALRRALRKLGVTTRAGLVELHGALVPSPDREPSPQRP